MHAPIVESTVGLVHLLFKTGGVVGAFLLILYAMVVPTVKLGALILAELWREHEDPRKVRQSKHLIEAGHQIRLCL